MNDKEALDWVNEHMPSDSAAALLKFTEINPHWRGANWDDCLDMLLNADANLDVTEPLYEDEELRAMGALPSAVALTCLYGSKAFALDFTPDQRLRSVKATIANNGGAQ